MEFHASGIISFPKMIENKLKENRPNLSVNSVKTYVSILKNLYKNVYPDEEHDLRKFKNQDKFIKYLEDVDGSKRKTYLSALIVICGDDCEKYSRLMNEDGTKYNQEQKTQKRTEKQTENWIEQDELQEVISRLEIEANKIFKLKTVATMEQLQVCQNFILLCLVSGKYIPVRRSLDWAEMRVSNFDEESNSFEMPKRKPWKFVFRRYKTQQYHGIQEIVIPSELKKILTKWIKLLSQVCPNAEYLLIDKFCNKLSSVKITQRLNKIFGKSASINILRHSFITEQYRDMPSLEELQENATAHGHSLMEELEYIKR
jgi:hypothetical protein